jgi:transposase
VRTRSRACAKPSRHPARGLRYLPPYSPDLNPIEHAFAKLKALLRSATARSVAVLWHTVGQFLGAFSPAECSHYLAHAGYVPSNREPL